MGDDSQYATSAPGSGFVTLGRSEFDLLCRKLNGLENSISELKREIRRNQDQNGNHDSDGGTSSDGPRTQTHYDVHGLHTKNESVSVGSCGLQSHADVQSRERLFTLEAAQSQQCCTP